MRTRRSSYSMLRSLPAVFDIRDMEITLEMDRNYIKNTVHRWSEREMIVPLGPRAGVYFNLVADPKGPQGRIKEAVTKLLGPGRPVIGIGAMALHHHGWTTQRPYLRELAVPVSAFDRTIPQMKGIIGVGRLKGWFQAVLQRSEEGVDGFLIAPPEFALVDAIKAKGAGRLWNPDPSDISLPVDVDADEVVRRIEEAADLLKVDTDQVREFVAEIDGLEDALPTP